MTTLYLTEPRSVVRKDGETLIVKIPANKESGAAERTVRIPLLKVDQVVVLGDSTVTTPALLALLEQKADICFCNYWGRFQGRLTPPVSKNVFVRAAQFRSHETYPQRVALAACFVRGKLHNERTFLLRGNRSLQGQEPTEVVNNAVETLNELIREVEHLETEEGGPPDPAHPQFQSALGTLQGLEGAGAAAFFRGFRRLLKQDLDFTGRHRRPPTDPVNALLSFGYTLLMNHVLSAVQIVGFDPYIGYLHSQGYGKPALALDLMEEMRTPIVDSVVLTVVNKQILQPKHFETNLAFTNLHPPDAKSFYNNLKRASTPKFSIRALVTKQPTAAAWNSKRASWPNPCSAKFRPIKPFRFVESSPKSAVRSPQSTAVTRTPDCGLRTPDSRLRTPDSRLRTQDSRLRTPDSRLRTPDSRLRTQDSRLRTPDSGLPTHALHHRLRHLF